MTRIDNDPKNPVQVRIGALILGIPASNDSRDGIANPQHIRYSLRHNVVQNETFPRKTTLCAQTKSVWLINISFCTTRGIDQQIIMDMIDPDNTGSVGAGPVTVETQLLGARKFWIESVNCSQPDGMDPLYYQWEFNFVEDVR